MTDVENKIPHFIVEGTQGSGKSTLIKYIMEQFPELNHHHFQYPEGDNADQKAGFYQGQYNLMFDLMVKNSERRWIFDRFQISEYVFGPRYRGISPTYLPGLEVKYAKLLPNTYIINVIADPEVILKRIEADTHRSDRVQFTAKEIAVIQAEYLMYSNNSPFKNIVIDTSANLSPEHYFNYILTVIESN